MRSRKADPADTLIDAISGWQRTVTSPLVVAIDGHGASGKSTIAASVSDPGAIAVVHVDDFWRVVHSAVTSGPAGPLDQDEPLASYYNWRRLRTQALQPLLAGQPAEFVAVDPDTLVLCERVVDPAPVIIVEGVSAASCALADIVDRAVLVQTPATIRLNRLHAQIKPEHWNQDWLDAERAYLEARPPDSFDLVLAGDSCD